MSNGFTARLDAFGLRLNWLIELVCAFLMAVLVLIVWIGVIAMPFFILAGEIMNRSGITMRLVAFTDSLVGYLCGGLAHSKVQTAALLRAKSTIKNFSITK